MPLSSFAKKILKVKTNDLGLTRYTSGSEAFKVILLYESLSLDVTDTVHNLGTVT